MSAGYKSSEFWLLSIALVGTFTLMGIGKLPADITTLGAVLAVVFGYGAQRTILKVKANGNAEGGTK